MAALSEACTRKEQALRKLVFGCGGRKTYSKLSSDTPPKIEKRLGENKVWYSFRCAIKKSLKILFLDHAFLSNLFIVAKDNKAMMIVLPSQQFPASTSEFKNVVFNLNPNSVHGQ